MDFERISLVISTLIAVFMAYMYWREWKLKKDKAPSESAVNVTAAVKNLSEALGMTTDELAEALKDSAQLRADLTKEKVETALRVAETAKHRKETDEKIESLNREYAREISALKEQVASWETRYNEIRDKYHKVVEVFVNYLHARGETVPADLALLLGDSITKFKLKGEK